MRGFITILFLVCATLLSIWGVDNSIVYIPSFQSKPATVERIKILFAGDIMAHMPQILKAQQGDIYDFRPSFQYVKPLFEDADLTIVNLETTLSQTPPYSGYPAFRSPAELAAALADAGIDVAVTANNHSLDMGCSGIEQTVHILRKYGVAPIGSFRDMADQYRRNPLVVERKGIKVAIFAYTYGTNGIDAQDGAIVPGLDTVRMATELQQCVDVDCKIAFVHWGIEYSRKPNREQKELATFLHRVGCQLVIGSHPHVVQGAESSKREVTVYSLGNFISNQRERYTDGGIIAQVSVEKSDDGCSFWLDINPVWVRLKDYVVIPKSIGDTLTMSKSERTAYLQFMQDTEKIFTSQF